MSDDPVVQERLNKINQYSIQGYTDREIYSMLEIPASTYYNYKKQLQKESAERFKEQRLEDLAHHYDELYDRYSQMYRIGMDKLAQAKETMNPTKDFASTLREIKSLAKDMCELKVNTNLSLHEKSTTSWKSTTKTNQTKKKKTNQSLIQALNQTQLKIKEYMELHRNTFNYFQPYRFG